MGAATRHLRFPQGLGRALPLSSRASPAGSLRLGVGSIGHGVTSRALETEGVRRPAAATRRRTSQPAGRRAAERRRGSHTPTLRFVPEPSRRRSSPACASGPRHAEDGPTAGMALANHCGPTCPKAFGALQGARRKAGRAPSGREDPMRHERNGRQVASPLIRAARGRRRRRSGPPTPLTAVARPEGVDSTPRQREPPQVKTVSAVAWSGRRRGQALEGGHDAGRAHAGPAPVRVGWLGRRLPGCVRPMPRSPGGTQR
jgi:hypothetical protein